MKKITIGAISGFPEFSPEEQILFNWAKNIIASSFEKVGAVPIETAAVERLDVLLSKGGNNKEIYAITRAMAEGDEAKKELGLHFDLTIPLARYTIENYSELIFPFKRYQIQPVWRGERSQAGRYRQFYQCDIDVIGVNSLSLLYDAEMPYVIYEIFTKMNIGDFKININNRKILSGFFTDMELNDDAIKQVTGIIDEYLSFNSSKTLVDTEAALLETGIDMEQTNQIIGFFELAEGLDNEEVLAYLRSRSTEGSLARLGIDELQTVYEGMVSMGVNKKNVKINLKIVRGLNYYTGTIYETRLEANPGLGSICSGGRYDNLTQYFSDRVLPGVGISIGLTRLIPDLIRTGVLKVGKQTVADVLIANFDHSKSIEYVKIAAVLREAGINTEVFLEDKKIGKQIEYANKKGFRLVLFKGPDEDLNGTIKIKNMDTGDQQVIADTDLVGTVSALLQHQLQYS